MGRGRASLPVIRDCAETMDDSVARMSIGQKAQPGSALKKGLEKPSGLAIRYAPSPMKVSRQAGSTSTRVENCRCKPVRGCSGSSPEGGLF